VKQFTDDRGAELRALFFESAKELLQSLNDEGLKLEKRPDDTETVRGIRRIVHTLKGDAAAVGFRELSELAHAFEDALALESAQAHKSLPEIAFHAADIFGEMLEAYRRQAKLPSTTSLKKRIQELSQEPKSRKTKSKTLKASPSVQTIWTEYETTAAQAAANAGKSIYHVRVVIDPQCAMPIAARQLLLKALAGIGEVLGARPEATSTESSKKFETLVASASLPEALAAKCRIPTVTGDVKVDAIDIKPQIPVARKTESAGAPASTPEAESHAAVKAGSRDAEPSAQPVPAENILRVDAERIDNVLNLVGELIIGKSMLQQALNEFARRFPKDACRGRFADAMAFQARILNDLQRSVMKVRMVPVEQLFRRFPRMVRDVARQCGREVELVLSGENTDLDKGLLDGIAEPMTHLVRNAIGHGIETPEERTRAGKPAKGTIRLDAYHQGNQVIVEINDDGRGIDVQKVRARAVERGFLKPEEASRASESSILDFIFRPGFSTADEITEISGRGVGLDVVHNVLQRLKGTVQVESRPGQGTIFRLRLPLTLAIIKALLFRVERRLYAIPLNAVAEIARAYESDLHRVDNREVLQLRNQVLPIIRLANQQTSAGSQKSPKIFILVVRIGDRKFGLLVNALEGEEELVIKALDDHTVDTDMVSGASILGDGRVVLILNLGEIVERFTKFAPENTLGPVVGMFSSQSLTSSNAPEVQA